MGYYSSKRNFQDGEEVKVEQCGFRDGGAAVGGKCRVEGGAAAVSARCWQGMNVGLKALSPRDKVNEVVGAA